MITEHLKELRCGFYIGDGSGDFDTRACGAYKTCVIYLLLGIFRDGNDGITSIFIVYDARYLEHLRNEKRLSVCECAVCICHRCGKESGRLPELDSLVYGGTVSLDIGILRIDGYGSAVFFCRHMQTNGGDKRRREILIIYSDATEDIAVFIFHHLVAVYIGFRGIHEGDHLIHCPCTAANLIIDIDRGLAA